MSNAKTTTPRPVPPPQGTAYSRFIPREELQGFASWTPDPFGAHAHAAAQRRTSGRGQRAGRPHP
jgi:flagellar assembly protein FliH